MGILSGLIFIPFVAYKAAQHSLADLLAVLAFGAGILLVYTTSTLYHAIKAKPWKEWFRIGDHIAIYFLIAGSYTPLVVRYLS
jgi:hemolysin III